MNKPRMNWLFKAQVWSIAVLVVTKVLLLTHAILKTDTSSDVWVWVMRSEAITYLISAGFVLVFSVLVVAFCKGRRLIGACLFLAAILIAYVQNMVELPKIDGVPVKSYTTGSMDE